MRHEDWLYLLEFFMKCGDAETIINAMKWEEPQTIIRLRQKITDAGFTSYYL